MCATGCTLTTMRAPCGHRPRRPGRRDLSRRRARREAKSRGGAGDLPAARRMAAGGCAARAADHFVADRPGHDARYAIDPARSSARSAGARRQASTAAWRRRWTGTSPIRGGVGGHGAIPPGTARRSNEGRHEAADLGAGGQVGQAPAARAGAAARGLTRAACDITDRRRGARASPRRVVGGRNCAAYTAVDRAEASGSWPLP